MPKEQPVEFRNAEAQTKTRACYIYIVTHGAELMHLAGYNSDVIVNGLPVGKGSDPQTFTRAQIAHSAPEQKSEIGANTIDLSVGINDSTWATQLREMVLYTTPQKITVTIMRVNSALLPGPVIYGTDTYTVFKGVVINLSFAQGMVTLKMVSLLMQSDGKVPRYFYQKTCQHMLGGNLCGVDLDDAAFNIETTLTAVTLRGRTVEFSATLLDGDPITAETFQGGKLIELDGADVLSTIAITATEVVGGGIIRLYLAWWSRTLAIGTTVKVVRGCNRTVGMCDTVFDNKARFGGFPSIPDVSPSIHGV